MDTVAANYMYKPVNFTHWEEPVADKKDWPGDANKWVDTVTVDSSWSETVEKIKPSEADPLQHVEDVHSETASSPSFSIDSKSSNGDECASFQDDKTTNDENRRVFSQAFDVNDSLALKNCESENVAGEQGLPTQSALKVEIPSPYPEQTPQCTESSSTIEMGAKFHSFADFEKTFKEWMNGHFHPFRVASSEQMRQPNHAQDEVFRYRYIVYHCIHYGTPRMRGNGKRPNQSYLPSGCKAMLRLNFSYNDNALRITTLHTEHVNHEIGPEHFGAKRPKFSPYPDKIKRETPESQSSKSSSISSNSVKVSPVPASTWSPTIPEPPVMNPEVLNNNSASVLQLLSPFLNLPQIQQPTSVFQNLAHPQPSQNSVSHSISLPSLSKILADAYSNAMFSTQQQMLSPQQQMLGVLLRQQQDKMLALHEEYRRLLSALTNVNFNNTDVLEKAVIQLKCIIDYIQQNSIQL